MKRVNNIYEKIYDIENIRLADKKARKGKKCKYGIKIHDKNKERNIQKLHNDLKNKMYRTSKYDIYTTICGEKEREIYRLPYYPDRICHHAIMNVMEPIWVKLFTRDTYSCIKKRGIHGAFYKLKKDLKDIDNTNYCLKLDIKKFYPSIDHNKLKIILRRKIKDKELLWLLDEIIDSAPGVPIGNYLSQYLANIYLAYFDHWIKENLKIKYYYRYCDDMVILNSDKNVLWEIKKEIENYLISNLKLKVKDNYQVFPIDKRGIDFLGYVFYHSHIRLRKGMKKRFARKIKKINSCSYASYKGWTDHCNARNLIKKLSA